MTPEWTARRWANERSEVGTVRPSQLIYSYGVGSTVDLPQFSAMVMGLDDWPGSDMEEIREDRLLRVVRHVLGAQVRQLKAAPVREEPGTVVQEIGGGRCAGGGFSPLAGVYTMQAVGAHPVGVVRVSCGHEPAGALVLHPQELPSAGEGDGDPGAFPGGVRERSHRRFSMGRVPARTGGDLSGPARVARCGRKRRSRRRDADVPACQKRKPMAPAFSEEGRAELPACRGRHPHLRVAPLEECHAASQPITLGATNMWFSRTLSALSIPSTADPLEQLVEQDLTALFEDAESERDVKLLRKGHARYDQYTDAQIWAAVEKLRAMDGAAPLTPKDLKLPEWKLFSNPDPAKNSSEFAGSGWNTARRSTRHGSIAWY